MFLPEQDMGSSFQNNTLGSVYTIFKLSRVICSKSNNLTKWEASRDLRSTTPTTEETRFQQFSAKLQEETHHLINFK